MPTISRRRLLACAALPLLASSQLAHSQGSKDMTIVVGYPAGGSLDAMARALAQKLSALRGHGVIIDNRPGFSGNIGAQYVARSPADGRTVLMSALTTYAINANLMGSSAGYDLMKDFEHVAIVGNLPNVIVVPSSLPVKTLQEFIQAAKKNPGGYSYATTGNGSLEHVAGEMLKRAAGIDLLAVPYKGSTPALTDLIGGQIQVMFVNTSTAINNLKGGRIKVLAIAGPARSPAMPDVPTLRESGVKLTNDVVSIFGISAPRGTSKAVVDQLNADLNTALKDAQVHQRFEALGIEVVTQSPAEARKKIDSEVATWAKVLGETGITLQ
ncbi:tripartite tricarboxylate transporter substrate binding protein [Variovorax sp. EBFNA2]|uniref:Bug family tripartite tricarboxylate transporter substrate binding protein n=1 Tax=Variovorax sp. EBFNA2 TaxID=3342097 RepID=UPI0029BFAE45|nr:tripartite tricarboxylate transporter substrate binding protein [Variovorax boronicumulans]WPG41409.1 tripartite tricarboxylate transporter substrate binding protein [Variovorax boronicumulans]